MNNPILKAYAPVTEETAAMAEIVKAAARERRAAGTETELDEGCRYIAAKLSEAGYAKADPYVLSFLDQLSRGLKDFHRQLEEIIRRTDLLTMAEEDTRRILGLVEHARKKVGR